MTLLQGFGPIILPDPLSQICSEHLGGVRQESHILNQFNGGLLLTEDTRHNLPVGCSSIRRYECYIFIPVILSVIYLSWYF